MACLQHPLIVALPSPQTFHLLVPQSKSGTKTCFGRSFVCLASVSFWGICILEPHCSGNNKLFWLEILQLIYLLDIRFWRMVMWWCTLQQGAQDANVFLRLTSYNTRFERQIWTEAAPVEFAKGKWNVCLTQFWCQQYLLASMLCLINVFRY